MTVAELIKRLREYPQDATVCAYAAHEEYEEITDSGIDVKTDLTLWTSEVGFYHRNPCVTIIGG